MKHDVRVVALLVAALYSACIAAEKIVDDPYAVDANVVKRPTQAKNIDELSVRTLYLILTKGNQPLLQATGFVVEKDKIMYLVTNWHVLSGRHPSTNKPIHGSGGTPTEVLIWHNGQKLGTWVRRKEPLYDKKGKRRWIEHKLGQKVDVVALRLQCIDKKVRLYPLNLSLAEKDMRAYVGIPVSIIGYPLGFAGPGRFPIWKTGHIASEPDLDYNGEPLFLIDATTRGGMSGAPVVLRQVGGYMTKSGDQKIVPGVSTRFLGIYSGRMPGDSELGRVWRPRLIKEILDQGK